MKNVLQASVLIIGLFMACKSVPLEEAKEPVLNHKEMIPAYIGTYTKKEDHVNGKAEGIYLIYQQPMTGALALAGTVAKVINPSFVRISADKKNLYAVSELGPGDADSGFIYSYKVNEDHSLTELGRISTEGFAPCHIAEDPAGKYIFVSNYVGGVVVVYEKDAAGNLKQKQTIIFDDPENSHPHSVSISANNRFAYIADLGHDRIWQFTLNSEKGVLEPLENPYIQLSKGAGPRHFVFSISEEFAYSVNELNSTVSTFRRTKEGNLEHLADESTLPEGFEGENSAADIHLHPSGQFLYVSNRGHNSIASFRINDSSGTLVNTGFTSTGGEKPRSFAISPQGTAVYAANQDSDNILMLNIDPNTGMLTSNDLELEIWTPVSIEFLR